MNNGISFSTSFSINEIHSNTQTSIIIITEDKLENVVNKHTEACKAKDRWHAPFGIIVSLGIMFATSDFKNSLGMDKEFWRAFSVLVFILVAGWLIYVLFKLKNNWNIDSSHLIQTIKNASQRSTQTVQPPPVQPPPVQPPPVQPPPVQPPPVQPPPLRVSRWR